MEKRIRRALLALLLVGLVLTFGSFVAQADPAPQGVDPYFDTHLGPVKERPVSTGPTHPGAEGDLLDWSGVDWSPWVDGLQGNPLWALVAAGIGLLAVFGERLGVRQRVWDLMAGGFTTTWDLIRQTQAGWWITEIIRRATLPWVGMGIWVTKQVVAIPGLVKDLLSWQWTGIVENVKTGIALILADRQGRSDIIANRLAQLREDWEQVKAFPGLLWDDFQTRWSRGWNGLVRMWTDPNVSNEELLQWGADHASMIADASVVVSAGQAAAVRAESWLTKVRTVREVGRLPVVSSVTGSGTQVAEGTLTLNQRLLISRQFSELPGVTEAIPKSVWAKAMPAEALKTIRLEATPGRLNYVRGFVSDAADGFRPGFKVFQGRVQDDLFLVQFHENGPLTRRSLKWWTSVGQAKWLMTGEDVHEALALLSEWGPRNAVSLARIPKGSKVTFLIGDAVEQASTKIMEVRSGGGLQLRFLDFDQSWITKKWP